MKLNMYILRDYLDLPIIGAYLRENKNTACLQDVVLYLPGEVLRSDMLYVLTSEQLPTLAHPDDHAHLAICGMRPGEEMQLSEQGFDALFLGEKDPQKVQRAFQNIFHIFREWELELFRLMSFNTSLKEIARTALPFLENPICLYTPSMRSIFFCGRGPMEDPRYYFGDKEGEYMSEKYFNNLRLDQHYMETMAQTEPSVFPADVFGYRVLYYNIRENLVYQARLLICETKREIRDSDHFILKTLGSFLQKSMERQNMRVDDHPQNLDLYVLRLIGGQQPEEAVYAAALAEFGWKLQDSYCCLHLPVSRSARASYAVKALCNRLEMRFSRSLCVVKGTAVIWIIDLQQMRQSYEQITARATAMLKEDRQKAGISRPFTGFHEIYTNYQQAVAAYALGSKAAPEELCYFYEDYALQDLIGRAAGSYSPASLCPEGLLALAAYDAAHNLSYTRTLKVYLENNMREAQTIRILFMQRATFRHQISRIRDLSGLDLEDPEIRLRLLIVFRILDLLHISPDQLVE